MIPIYGLATVEEVLARQVPNPGGAIAQHNGVAGLGPVARLSFGPELLAKVLRPAQVGDIGVRPGVGQLDLVPRGGVKGGFEINFQFGLICQGVGNSLIQCDRLALCPDRRKGCFIKLSVRGGDGMLMIEVIGKW